MKINKAAGAAILAIATAGSLFTAIGAGSATASVPKAEPATAPALSGHVVLDKSRNLVNGETVKVTASQFPDLTDAPILYITECASQAILHEDPSFCDTVTAHGAQITNTGTTPGTGGGVGTYKIRTGSNFAPTNKKGKCDNLHLSCFLIVADGATSATTKNVGFTTITLKDTRVATTTKLSAPSSGKAGSKATVTASFKVGKAKPTGKVVFKVGGKTVATVNVSKTGKATAKIKLSKGANKITATYSGDINYKTSTGRATITGK